MQEVKGDVLALVAVWSVTGMDTSPKESNPVRNGGMYID
jgi:hypothetical protein